MPMSFGRTLVAIALLFPSLCAVAQDSPFGPNGPAPTGKQQAAPAPPPPPVAHKGLVGKKTPWGF
jgi:hypothetical protein